MLRMRKNHQRMKLRYAIVMGLVNSLALGVLLGTYNGSVPPPVRGSLRALVSWPTGNAATLFLALAAVWACCLLCVSWKGSRVPGWQVIICMTVTAVTLVSSWQLSAHLY